MKVLASIVYAVGVIFAGILLWWLVLGCEKPIESPESEWEIIAEVERAKWDKMEIEDRLGISFHFARIYARVMSCYVIDIGNIKDEEIVYITVKCLNIEEGVVK